MSAESREDEKGGIRGMEQDGAVGSGGEQEGGTEWVGGKKKVKVSAESKERKKEYKEKRTRWAGSAKEDEKGEGN